jgi:hypothetical protein
MYHFKQHGDDDVTDPLKKIIKSKPEQRDPLDSSSSFIIYKEIYIIIIIIKINY